MTATSKLTSQRDLLAVALVSVVCAVVCLVVRVSVIRVLCAVPLGFICPGYALAAALFARSNLELPARMMLTMGLSFVTLVLGGIVLNTTAGIYLDSWVVLLLVVVGAAVAFAAQRRDARSSVALPVWRPSPRQTVNAIVLALALAIGVGAVVASRIPLGAPNSVGYETLSAAPSHGDSAVALNVYSARQHTTTYQLRAYVNQKLVLTRTITLKPGRSTNLTVPVGSAQTARSVNAAVVMLGGHWTPRHVYLTLPAA